MPTDDLLSLLGTSDLLNFNNTVTRSDPYAISSNALAGWNPDMSSWSGMESGITSFGKSFLSGILGNYARQNASDQLSKVVSVLPSLRSDPASVMLPEGVDSDAFNVLKGSAILKKDQRDSIVGNAAEENVNKLYMSVLGEGVKAGTIDPGKAIIAIKTGDFSTVLNEGGAAGESPKMTQLLNAYKITDPELRSAFKTPDELEKFILHGPGGKEGGKSGLPAAMIPDLAKSKGVIDEARLLAGELQTGISWGDLQKSKMFSGLDKEGIGLQLKNLADRLSRARTGAAMNKNEEAMYSQLVSGDLTADPPQVAKLLRKLADSESRVMTSQLDFVDNMNTGGLPALKESLVSKSYVVKTLPNGRRVKVLLGQ